MKDGKIMRTVNNAHIDDITQIVILTDYVVRLTFVTLSLDGSLKFWNETGEFQQSVEHEGVQFVNGCIIPNKPEMFLVAAVEVDNNQDN